MTNNQLAENSITQLLNSVKLARDNAERDDNRVDHSFYYALTIALDELQERRKSDSEPVATLDVQSRRPDGNKFALAFSSAAHKLPDDVYFLYCHAQPAHISALKLPPKLSNDRERSHELNTGVDTWNRCIDEVAKINGEMILAGRVDGLHPSTVKLVNDFATALAEKLLKAELKYGYSNAWTNNGWMTECLADFHRHIAKGDPRDVAAYCAFMWYHGWKTEAAQPAPVVPLPDVVSVLLNHLEDVLPDDAFNLIDVKAWNAVSMLTCPDACRAAMLNGGKS